jgi:hypothetical protein
MEDLNITIFKQLHLLDIDITLYPTDIEHIFVSNTHGTVVKIGHNGDQFKRIKIWQSMLGQKWS